MPESRAEWTNVVISGIALLCIAFGGYGHFSGMLANKEARILVLEKESVVSRKDREEMDNELDVLWVDTSKNKDRIVGLDKDLKRFDKSFEKFADAVDRLSISVVRLEERIGKKPVDINIKENK